MNRMDKDRDLAKSLSLEEKKYLLAVQRGDVANVQRWVFERNKTVKIRLAGSPLRYLVDSL